MSTSTSRRPPPGAAAPAPSRYTSRASHESCDSYETYESQSTAPTSAYTSTQASVKEAILLAKSRPVHQVDADDISPSTSCCPRSSVDTFDSALDSNDDLTRDVDMDSYDDCPEIPPLPIYTHQVLDPHVCPSTPQDFGKLFPSRDRLSIRHDDFTPDGNLNLRVDTVVPGRRRQTMQLFHLRMYDLAKREFSLRRYCRDSGREVCNSKRKYVDAPAAPALDPALAPADEQRPGITRSVSSAFRSFGARKPLTRTNSGASHLSAGSKKSGKRPISGASYEGGDELASHFSRVLSFDRTTAPAKQKPLATNSIKLEFSNYARVDVARCGSGASKRYEFEWWGHRYTWKRITDKTLGSVSFHLVRDGSSTPVAHIVPETRSPTQVMADEEAGGWVPPCHMWISDQSIVDAATDVADVIVSTGLMALVDDCIKQRWGNKGAKRVHRFGLPLTSRTVDFEYANPRSIMHNLFHRRASDAHADAPRHRHSLRTY